jgi:hypothetical protein
MANTRSRKVLTPSFFIAMTAALAISGDTSPASAQTLTTCVPVLMEYSNQGGPGAVAGETLIVQCSGNPVSNFYGLQSSPAGCASPGQPTDVLKVWASETQAAILSGHNVQIYWNQCSLIQVIVALDLLNH